MNALAVPVGGQVNESRRLPLPTRKFVSSSVLAEMTKGSYERVLDALNRAVQRDRALFAKSFGEAVKPVATFRGRAIVSTTTGNFFRVEWKDSDDGEIRFTKVEEIKDVPVRSYNEVVEDVIGKIAKGILDGRQDDVRQTIKESMGILTYAGVSDPSDLARLMRENLAAPRMWKRYVEAKAEDIRNVLGIAESAITPAKAKYRHIWEGEGDADAGRFLDVVREDANALLVRLDSLCTEARKSYDEYVKQRQTFRPVDEDTTPMQFEMVSEDFFTDSESVRDTTINLIHSSNARAMAEAHDAISENIHRFELAARFVKAMAENLMQGRKN